MDISVGLVDQIKIQISTLEFFQGLHHGSFGLLKSCVLNPKLGGDKQILPQNPAVFDRFPYCFFVFVRSGSINR
jgi:hypothetical protein